MLTAAEAAAEELAEQGVEIVTTLIGHSIIDLLEACAARGIRVLDARHELGAAFIAEGIGRFTRRPGVCLVTGGPGLTNAVTALASALSAGSPMVLVSGYPDSRLRDRGPVHEMVDQVGLVRSVTKASFLVSDGERVGEYLRRALRLATTPPAGPVCLSIAIDALRVRSEPHRSRAPESSDVIAPLAAPRAVDRALSLICAARKPVVIAGNGAWWADAGEALAALVELIGAPLFTTGFARGIVPDDHECCLGLANHQLNPAFERVLASADLVVTVGHTLNYEQAFGRPPVVGNGVPIVQLDADAAAAPHYEPSVTVIGAIDSALQGLVTSLADDQGERRPAWIDIKEERGRTHNSPELLPRGNQSGGRIHPAALYSALADGLPDDTMFILDGGNVSQWGRALLPARGADLINWLTPFAALGCGIGYGIAAKLTHPQRTVVVVLGDGSFGLQAMEIDTAVRHGVSLIVVAGNDAAWGTDLLVQTAEFGPDRLVASRLSDTPFSQLAEALGARGFVARTTEELSDTVRRVQSANGVSVIDVKMVTAANPLARALMEGGADIG